MDILSMVGRKKLEMSVFTSSEEMNKKKKNNFIRKNILYIETIII